MLIAIRTDASSVIGLGHLRRCLSLAQALRALGSEVEFGLRPSDVNGTALAASEGFPAHAITGSVDPLSDAQAFCALWSGRRPDGVVVDHYALGAGWHTAVRGHLGCNVAAIDDLADRPMAVDVLIDHNLVPPPGHRDKYASVLQQSPALWLCGPRFALLGASYAQAPAFKVKRSVNSIGIFMGGSDPAGLTSTVVQACRDVARFTGPIEVVSTSANPRLVGLKALAVRDTNMTLSIDLPELSAFYRRHDLQIGAGGGATWERCSVGVPTLTLCVADNQLAVIPALRALGALATVTHNDVQTLGIALAALIESPAARRDLSERSRALVDGQGASRVALALLARCPAGLRLRPAGHADAHTIWQWRNDAFTRCVSRQPQVIPLGEHRAWLNRTLADPQRHLRIAMIGPREVGVIRFDRVNGSMWEVSLYLDPALHSLGLGIALLRQGETDLLARAGPLTIQAEVLLSNPGSRRLFLAAGYSTESPTTFSKTLAACSEAAAPSPESTP